MCETTAKSRNFATFRQQFMSHLSTNHNVPEMSKRFGALNSNLDRVNFVLELLNSSGIDLGLRSDRKSDEIATKLKDRGNEMFKVKKLNEAWEFYTKSISTAEENSANLGLAYANRSAVLLEMNLQKECLMDIKRALGHNYPDHLKPKLVLREKNAKNLETICTKFHEETPRICQKNPQIECAASCVEIQENPDFGRFVVASRDIKVGEILATEQPFACFLVNQRLNHCHHCLNLCYNLIPCKDCTHALYCGETCRNEAFEKYHKYECEILGSIEALELDKLKTLSLRIAFVARNQNIKNLTAQDSIYCSNRYTEIHNLVTNTSKRSINDLFEKATAAAVIFKLVKHHSSFFNEHSEDTFKEILLLHMQTGPSNFHEISELSSSPSNTYEPQEIASGVFAFLSLLNHSCCPNVTRFSYGSTLVLRAIQDIRKGEQCFDNYGYHFAMMDRKDRQKHLKNQYYFDCICEACNNDWGLYHKLPKVGGFEIGEEVMRKLSSGDVQTAKNILEESLVKLGDLQALQPCQDFCQIQEVVKQCFAILANKRQL